MLRRMVEQRFDAETAERIGVLLEGVTDWERLTVVGEWALDTQSGAELERHVASLLRSP